MTLKLVFSLGDIKDLLVQIGIGRNQQQKQHEEIMNGLQNLTTAVTGLTTAAQGLTTAVDAAVTDIGALSPTDAQLNTLADSVNSLTANLASQAQRLNDAVNAPVTAPPAP